MSLAMWILVLLAAGAVLLVMELMLPAQGVLGILGVGSIVAAIGCAFYKNQWLGLALFLGVVGASPFVIKAALDIWPRTPIGRRVVLQPIHSPTTPCQVAVGQVGIARTELRPMGECEFDSKRIEARSERGIIRASSQVRVVSIDAGLAVVTEI